jgi:D-glycero-alpha-D-manno-heptose-7-phosphate kinase
MRVSLVGGGTDFSYFYKKYGGLTISFTINKYMYVILNKHYDKNYCFLKYSKTEKVKNLKDIEHPLIRNAIKKMNIWGMDINSVSDVPSGTGLGSSSAFTVSLLNGLYFYKNNRSLIKSKLAEMACKVEIDLSKSPIGKQDQYSTCYGGVNIIKFNPNESVNVSRILSKSIIKFIEENTLILDTGIVSDNKKILTYQKKNIKSDNKYLNILKEIKYNVLNFEKSLYNRDIKSCGQILTHNWFLKKKLTENVNYKIFNEIYEDAMQLGASGGKVLGAGNRGFFLILCSNNKRKKILDHFRKLPELKFKIDTRGSDIIKYI